MNTKIDNKLAFNIYVWANFSFFVLFCVYVLLLIVVTHNNDTALHDSLIGYILIWPIFIVITRLFDYLIHPAYFEFQISNGEIRFISLNPKRIYRFNFILMAFYKRHLIEQTINQQSYNNYILKIDRFGFRRNLIFQKLENGKLYKSTSINISFLGIKKYTNLILSIDRLQEKITLN